VLLAAAALLAALATAYALSWQVRTVADALLHNNGRSIARIEGRAETIVVSKTPRLVADYYAGSDSHPLVLVVPGSTPLGRRSGLCRLLAARLSRDGFPVLALDLRGFGGSSDPDLPLTPDFRFEDDVAAAARYARRHGLAPGGRIVYAGHSLGAGVILRAGRLAPRPEALVAMGAPATRAAFARGREAWRRRFARERFHAMRMTPDPASIEVMGDYLLGMDVIAQLSRRDLPPTLLIFGEKEGGTAYVRERVAGDSLPCDFEVVAGAPHSYHVVDGPWGFVLYDREMLGRLVSVIEGWIVAGSRTRAGGS
jgi:pimeloyl-ACP methyl ester carboxylesterase